MYLISSPPPPRQQPKPRRVVSRKRRVERCTVGPAGLLGVHCAWKSGQNKTEAREAYSRIRRCTWWLVDGRVPNNLTVGQEGLVGGWERFRDGLAAGLIR